MPPPPTKLNRLWKKHHDALEDHDKVVGISESFQYLMGYAHGMPLRDRPALCLALHNPYDGFIWQAEGYSYRLEISPTVCPAGGHVIVCVETNAPEEIDGVPVAVYVRIEGEK